MELTTEQKNILIKDRLNDYKVKIFQLKMDLSASEAAEDYVGKDSIERNLERLKKAYSAVEGMLEDADTADTTA